MKKFSEYKEQQIVEGLLSNIVKVVKDDFVYFVDKAKKFILQAISPIAFDGYSADGIQVATKGENVPEKKEIPNNFEVEHTSQLEKVNLKTFIKEASNALVTEGAVEGFGEFDGTHYRWKDRMNGGPVLNPVQDVDQSFVKNFLLSNIIKVSNIKGHSKPIVLFGAPGVGKSSVVNTVIRAYNEGHKSSKKGLIVIDCANLGLDSLSLVMPSKNDNTPAIIKAAGLSLSPEDAEQLKKTNVTDMVKEWLPCYRPTGDPDIDKKADEIANGHVSVDGVSLDGGIILLDELLRVQDPGVFGQLMNLILSRQLGEWVLGSKWTFVCASNRANDDKLVASQLKSAPTAFFNRFAGVYNVEPNMTDWMGWAKGTAEAASFDFDVKGQSHVEDRGWRVDPRICDFISRNPKSFMGLERNDITAGEFAGTTPRSWTTLSEYLWDIADANGLGDWIKLPKKDMREVIIGIIGAEYGQPLYEEVITEWEKKGSPSNQGSSTDDKSATCREYISVIEHGSADEANATAKLFQRTLKTMTQQEVDSKVVSPCLALWKSASNARRQFICNIIAKVFPDLKGRVDYYLDGNNISK